MVKLTVPHPIPKLWVMDTQPGPPWNNQAACSKMYSFMAWKSTETTTVAPTQKTERQVYSSDSVLKWTCCDCKDTTQSLPRAGFLEELIYLIYLSQEWERYKVQFMAPSHFLSLSHTYIHSRPPQAEWSQLQDGTLQLYVEMERFLSKKLLFWFYSSKENLREDFLFGLAFVGLMTW